MLEVVCPRHAYRRAKLKYEGLGKRDEDRAAHGEHCLAALIDATVFQFNAASAILQFPFLQDRGLGVNCVAMKNGERVADVGVFERLQTRSANVRLAHSHYQTDHDGALHQSLSMLGSGRIMSIDVYRVLIHAQQAEQRVIELRNSAAGPVAKCLARFQFSKMSTVPGSWQLTTIASYRCLVRPAAGVQAGTTRTTRSCPFRLPICAESVVR
jgi:hypothetical protein